jgi:hypothetical protein
MANLPRGNRDLPGFTPLGAVHPLLHVGNEIAAAHVNDPQYFQCVVSTVPALDRSFARAPSLTTDKIFFLDEMGRESLAKEGHAKECILKGAAVVHAAISEGRRTLVHCAYGQNRSTAICCAYAIVYQGWSAADAMEYAIHQNRTLRQYYAQHPCSNPVFVRLLQQIAAMQPAGELNTSKPIKKMRLNLLTAWLSFGGRPQPSPRWANAPAAAPAQPCAAHAGLFISDEAGHAGECDDGSECSSAHTAHHPLASPLSSGDLSSRLRA